MWSGNSGSITLQSKNYYSSLTHRDENFKSPYGDQDRKIISTINLLIELN